MKNKIVLITKDAMCRSYLPVYGNTIWKGKTPNIDELAAKGTVFRNYYTVAPSSAMAFLGMFVQKFPYELDIHDYSPLKEEFKDTAFRKLNQLGYKCHIIWEKDWEHDMIAYSNCYEGTVLHSLEQLEQKVGAHFKHKNQLLRDELKSRKAIKHIEEEIAGIQDDKFFLWIHLPHVINGRIAYGDDIDLFDQIIGMLRKHFSDDSIYISSDHGNMNGTHKRVGYGFDVYDSAIRIPLITPRIGDYKEYLLHFSSVDLMDLIMTGEIRHRDFIYTDSAYYKQPHRKLAIIKNNYKYIFNKIGSIEEAYDLDFDSNEGINLINPMYHDKDRHVDYPLKELMSYTDWDRLHEFIESARREKRKIWRSETKVEHIYWSTRHAAGRVHSILSAKIVAKR